MDKWTTELVDSLDRGGARLMKKYRGSRTKREVAQELGVDPSLITLIENGKRNISKRVFREMARHSTERELGDRGDISE